jgi:opacity protein-like surface antigen
MKRYLIFGVLVAAMFISTPLYAQQDDVNDYYIGVGGSYAVENFNSNYDDAWGLNAKIGYHAHPLIDLEFEFNYVSEFEADEETKWFNTQVASEAEYQVETYIFAVKGYFPPFNNRTRLGVIVGAGIMDAEADAKVTVGGVTSQDSEHETGLCGKVGLGLDVFATEDVSVGLEGSYTFGDFDDLPDDDIEYFNFTAGIAYHF